MITQDVPLAAEAVGRGATCIGVRGEIIDVSNAAVRLAARNRHEEERLAGEFVSGPKAFHDRDKHKFAGALDQWLSKALREREKAAAEAEAEAEAET